MSKLKIITTWLIGLKHRQGEHNQKRHGWRYGSLEGARRALRAGVSENVADKFTSAGEREAYRKTQAKRGGITGWVEELPAKRPYVPTEGKPKRQTPAEVRARLEEIYKKHGLDKFDPYEQKKAMEADGEKYNSLESLASDMYAKTKSFKDAGKLDRAYYQSMNIYMPKPEREKLYQAHLEKRNALLDKATAEVQNNPEYVRLKAEMDALKSKYGGLHPHNAALSLKPDMTKANAARSEYTQALKAPDPAGVPTTVNKFPKAATGDNRSKMLAEETAFLGQVVSASVMPKASLTAQGKKGGQRSCFRPARVGYDRIEITKHAEAGVIAHETGHWMEFHNKDLNRKCREFLAKRTGGEIARKLKNIEPNLGYAPSEIARPDKFLSPYMGKIYRDGSTEILSMGLQMFYQNPIKLAREDPDYFDFILTVIRGEA